MSLQQYSDNFRTASVEEVPDETAKTSTECKIRSIYDLKYRLAISNEEDSININVRIADSRSKKRQRVAGVSDDTDAVEVVKQNARKLAPKKVLAKDKVETGSKKLRQLREIVGREGKGPMDYGDLAAKFEMTINLLELFQLSLEVSKQFRKLSTRKNVDGRKGSVRAVVTPALRGPR